jgi:hypothetical protein
MKLVRLVKICLNEIYSKFRVGKNLSDALPVHNGVKQGVSSSLLFGFHVQFSNRNVKESQERLELDGT